jgi:hypothetical protein
LGFFFLIEPAVISSSKWHNLSRAIFQAVLPPEKAGYPLQGFCNYCIIHPL